MPGAAALPGQAIEQAQRNKRIRRYRIAVIPGDGMGKEVIPAGLEVLEVLAERDSGFEWTFERFD